MQEVRNSLSSCVIFLVLTSTNLAVASDFAKRGTLLVAGSFSVVGTESDVEWTRESDKQFDEIDTESTSFSFMPEIGGFIIDSLYLGIVLAVDVSSSTTTFDDGDEVDESGTLVGVGVEPRVYLPLDEMEVIFFSVGATVGIGSIKYESDYFEESGKYEMEDDAKVSWYGIGGGFAWALGLDYGAVIELHVDIERNEIQSDIRYSGPSLSGTPEEEERSNTYLGLHASIGAFF